MTRIACAGPAKALVVEVSVEDVIRATLRSRMHHLELLSHLFDALPLGLVVLDANGRVVVYNRAEERMAARSRSSVMNENFFEEVAPCMNVQQLGGMFRDTIGRTQIDTTVEMSFPFPHSQQPRDAKVRLSSFMIHDAAYGFLILEDVSFVRSVERMREQLQGLLVHDLKNPLTAAMMNYQLLEEMPTIRDLPDAMESIEQGLAGLRRVNRMTLDLLDISRLETATMPLRRTRVDLNLLFARVINDNRTLARAREARVIALPGAPSDVSIDEDLIVRALDNLVENALRHAKTITLSAVHAGDQLELIVRDDGPGITESLRATLFDKYIQVSTPDMGARSSNRGLGLTFVRLVAQQHGGDANVSCPTDGGTTFTLTLRLPASPMARSAA